MDDAAAVCGLGMGCGERDSVAIGAVFCRGMVDSARHGTGGLRWQADCRWWDRLELEGRKARWGQRKMDCEHLSRGRHEWK